MQKTNCCCTRSDSAYGTLVESHQQVLRQRQVKKKRHAGSSGGKKNWGRFLCLVRTRPLNDLTCHHDHEELDRKRQRKEVYLQRPTAPEFDHFGRPLFRGARDLCERARPSDPGEDHPRYGQHSDCHCRVRACEQRVLAAPQLLVPKQVTIKGGCSMDTRVLGTDADMAWPLGEHADCHEEHRSSSTVHISGLQAPIPVFLSRCLK